MCGRAWRLLTVVVLALVQIDACEFFELPGGEAGFYIMKMIIEFLDFKALSSLMITSVIQQFCRIHKSLLLFMMSS